jgi:hypothetical protein
VGPPPMPRNFWCANLGSPEWGVFILGLFRVSSLPCIQGVELDPKAKAGCALSLCC